MKLKRNLLLIFFILAGIVLGGMLANLCANIPFLSWLAYSSSIGFNADSPFVLDLSVIKLTFGFSMGISVAQIITIALAIFCYNKRTCAELRPGAFTERRDLTWELSWLHRRPAAGS